MNSCHLQLIGFLFLAQHFEEKSLKVTLYQNRTNGSAPLHKMAAGVKNGKIFKRHLLYNRLADVAKPLQE